MPATKEKTKLPKRVVDQLYNSAERGAKFLDKNKPDWWRKVKQTELDMSNGRACILGQTYMNGVLNPYERGVKELGLDQSDQRQARYGFILPARVYDGEGAERINLAWSVLATAWVQEIKARRKAARARK